MALFFPSEGHVVVEWPWSFISRGMLASGVCLWREIVEKASENESSRFSAEIR